MLFLPKWANLYGYIAFFHNATSRYDFHRSVVADDERDEYGLCELAVDYWAAENRYKGEIVFSYKHGVTVKNLFFYS